MDNYQAIYETVQKRVAARYKRRGAFILSLVGTVAFNVVMWWAWNNTDLSVRIPIPECVLWLVTFLGIMDVGKNAIQMLLGELQEWSTQREFTSSLHQLALETGHKAKRDSADDPVMRLTDDGELVEDYLENWEPNQKIKRG